jgi:uncharacterized protein
MSDTSDSHVEAAVAATASSIDARRFTFECSVDGLDLRAGGYVTLAGHLGQVQAIELASAEAAEVVGDPGGGPGRRRERIPVLRGHGVVLEDGVSPFHRAELARASEGEVASWLERVRPPRAMLDVGALLLEPRIRFLLDAGGFGRHTFLCGQSGSGKSYALGTVLEQLLVQTKLRIVVLDPNSDFVRLNTVRDGVEEQIASRYRRAAGTIVVRRSGATEEERLHVRFTDCDAEEQAAVLRLDPIRDRDEYGVLVDLLESGFESSDSSARDVANRLLHSSDPKQQALGARLRNLGVHRWQIWSSGAADSIQDLVRSGGPRVLIVDLGSLETWGEKAIAAESVLAALWRRRAEREPTLLVIDEAHNVCPREPGDEITALATEHAARVAAEGRKFGLYMLVSTQRPQRVNELVVSQCDNLLLMRMASLGDLAYITETLSFAPEPLVEYAGAFRLGEGLVAGRFTSHPAFVRFGPRLAEEGGGDVPAAWAEVGES